MIEARGRKNIFETSKHFVANVLKSYLKDQSLLLPRPFNEYLDMNGSENPYFFGVYYPEFEEADADFLWGNWHASFESMKSGNADWEENGKAMQAKFDEISTCISPDYYDSYELYNDPSS